MNKLKETLTNQGRTKAWLARKMGVTANTVTNWCKSDKINEWKLKEIARLLNVELNELEE